MPLIVRVLLVLLGAGLLLTVIALFMQTNPPVTGEPAWDSPQTRLLAQRACFDCHSNETVWPWYDRLPISSWLVVYDTLRARQVMNFSEWSASDRGRDVTYVIQDGSMPPGRYTMLHPDAVLNAEEKQQLIQGLKNSLK
jgi:hypothetical protein